MAYLATIAAYGFPDIDIAAMLSLYRELGCSACQYYRNEHNPPNSEQALKIAMDAGVPFDSVHGVFGPALAYRTSAGAGPNSPRDPENSPSQF